MRAGALAVLDRPYAEDDLWEMIRKALAEDAARQAKREYRRDLNTRFNQLTPLEAQSIGSGRGGAFEQGDCHGVGREHEDHRQPAK